jgi:hypothetical protein
MASAALKYLKDSERIAKVTEEQVRTHVTQERKSREQARKQPSEQMRRGLPAGAGATMSGKLWLKMEDTWSEVGCNYHHDMDGNTVFRYALPQGERVVANCRLSGVGDRLVGVPTGAQEYRGVVELESDLEFYNDPRNSKLKSKESTGHTKNLFLFTIHGRDTQLELGVESRDEKRQWMEAVPSTEVKVCFDDAGLYHVKRFATGQPIEMCQEGGGELRSDSGIIKRTMSVEGTYTRWSFWKLPSKKYQNGRTLREHYKGAAAAILCYDTMSQVFTDAIDILSAR